jgi:hypothetical protein
LRISDGPGTQSEETRGPNFPACQSFASTSIDPN